MSGQANSGLRVHKPSPLSIGEANSMHSLQAYPSKYSANTAAGLTTPSTYSPVRHTSFIDLSDHGLAEVPSDVPEFLCALWRMGGAPTCQPAQTQRASFFQLVDLHYTLCLHFDLLHLFPCSSLSPVSFLRNLPALNQKRSSFLPQNPLVLCACPECFLVLALPAACPSLPI
ncbi:hypothetical protein GQ54DRAFT_148572 [Martensiomyces pterosporus]|nr:hypothetical protein GQ54DRAFT_148572 [Martensiomyces pterosporus]